MELPTDADTSQKQYALTSRNFGHTVTGDKTKTNIFISKFDKDHFYIRSAAKEIINDKINTAAHSQADGWVFRQYNVQLPRF